MLDLSKAMDWKQFEKEILDEFRQVYPDATILPNQFIVGRKTGKRRQVDILIEDYIAGVHFQIVVDCKSYMRKVDVKKVESFIGMMDDLGAQYGIIVTQKGYTSTALLRAHNESNVRVELDIVSLDALRSGQGFVGMPYSGFHGVLVPAPFGWVLDSNPMDGVLATLYQRGSNRDTALRANQWMYVNIKDKDEELKSIDDFVKWQEVITKSHAPGAKFKYDRPIVRKDGAPTLLRTIDIDHYPSKEYTGVVEFEKYFAFFVLFTPEEHLAKNKRKLFSVLENCQAVAIEREGLLDWKLGPLKEQLDSLTDPVQRSDNLLSQAGLLLDAKEFDSVDGLLDEAIQNYPPNYGAYRYRLRMYLEQKRPLGELERVVDSIFSVEPTNPNVCQAPMDLFGKAGRLKELVTVFERKEEEYVEFPEARGNVRYHLAFLYADILDQPAAAKQLMSRAKEDFRASLPADHEVFGSLEENIRLLGSRSRRAK